MRARRAFGNLFFVILLGKKRHKKTGDHVSAGKHKEKVERVAGIEPA